MARLSSDHRHARKQLFERFGDSTNSEAFTYYATEDGILIEYLKSEKDHLAYQDLGLKGTVSDKKAPDSPFQFKSFIVPPGQIWDWMQKKQLTFRDKKTGRFQSRIKSAHSVARSIALTGFAPKNYWETMDADIERLIEETVKLDQKFLDIRLDAIIETY